ncbi:Tn7-like element transposition protein TnsE [Bacillus wiedmannii]|uniref:Tn7-like element transposition protein TnsE n=1 Tax=Bacillus wiedmannii TaxID=1890302 RepID=UPI00211D365B|nr:MULTISPECIES: Tn7-like element transposition protein TnsE [Bacillus cereus group]
MNVLKVLENYSEVQLIKVTTGELPAGSEKRTFSYLDDGITKRKYIVASIELSNGRQYKVLEIERESRSLSMLILSSTSNVEWLSLLNKVTVFIKKLRCFVPVDLFI